VTVTVTGLFIAQLPEKRQVERYDSVGGTGEQAGVRPGDPKELGGESIVPIFAGRLYCNSLGAPMPFILCLPILVLLAAPSPDLVLFDFEDPAGLSDWSNLALDDPKAEEPPVKIALSTEHATAGKRSLKLTFAGGRWPTITTTKVPEDWMPYHTFHADVTVDRHCLVAFAVLQEKSSRARGWDGSVSRWVKTALLKPGRNHVSAPIHPPNDYSVSAKLGKVVRFEIFLYTPHACESIFVDDIRLSATKEPAAPANRSAGVMINRSGAGSGVSFNSGLPWVTEAPAWGISPTNSTTPVKGADSTALRPGGSMASAASVRRRGSLAR